MTSTVALKKTRRTGWKQKKCANLERSCVVSTEVTSGLILKHEMATIIYKDSDDCTIAEATHVARHHAVRGSKLPLSFYLEEIRLVESVTPIAPCIFALFS